ncbi:MAG: hypothetical protein M3347_16030, partial [Armatimonadota bacterium]|nr:hypothetical protein [Armatimonadota bacterium]
ALEYRPRMPLRLAGHDIRRVVVSRDRQRLALAGPANAATMTLQPCTTLLQLSGYSSRSLPRLRQIYEPYGIEPIIGPMPSQIIGISSTKTGVTPPFKPGGAIGVQLVSGDMDQTAVGTITFRWGNRVLAFGHPMFGQGPASLPIASAYVHEIFPSYMRSFKLASPVKIVGALQQDTQFAIGGTVGMTADMIPMKIDLRDQSRQIARTYRVRVMKDPVLTPQLIAIVAAEAMETTLGLASDKMVRVGLRMEIDGAEPIVRHNYLYANGVVTGAGLLDLGQSLAITQMNEFARGSIRKVHLDVAVEPVRKTARIKQIVANRNKVKPGETVQVSVLLEPIEQPDTTFTHTFNFTVPAEAPNGELRIAAGAAADYWPLQVRVGGPPPQPTNLKELVTAWGQVGAVNQLLVVASTERDFLKVDRQKVPNPPAAWSRLVRAARSTAIGAYNEIETRRATTDFALFGAQFLSVPIEDTKKRATKTPATPVPTPKAGGSEGSSSTENPPLPDVGGGDTPGSDTPDDGESIRSTTLDFERLLTTAPFLKQIKLLQQAAVNQTGESTPLQDSPAPPLPGREEPAPPITPATPAGPTTAPTPKATPAPTPMPTPVPDSKTLGRPAQSWVQQGISDFLSGDFERTLVTNDGRIRPAPPLQLLATTAETFVWSIAADTNGNTYLGTGNKARIIRIDAGGKQSTFYD